MATAILYQLTPQQSVLAYRSNWDLAFQEHGPIYQQGWNLCVSFLPDVQRRLEVSTLTMNPTTDLTAFTPLDCFVRELHDCFHNSQTVNT